MENDTKKLVLIDSNAIIHRAYHALPKTMATRKGELTNVVYGYTTTLIKVLEDLKPDYIAASFDVSKNTFRLAEYAEYKAHRVKADQELYDQIPRVRELLESLNIPIYEMEGFEADDVIGTIASKFECHSEASAEESPEILHSVQDDKCDMQVYIVTGDKDAFQLVDGNIFVYDLKGGLQNVSIIDSKEIRRLWNLDPADFIDLKALAGDPSDNIPGVPGIGGKTATDLIQKFDTLEKLYEKIETLRHSERSEESSSNAALDPSATPQDDKQTENIAKELNIKPRILRLLIENKDQAFLSQRLATIRKDVPIDFDLEKCRWGDYDKDKVRAFFEEMQFHSLLKRFSGVTGETPKTEEAKDQREEDKQLKLL